MSGWASASVGDGGDGVGVWAVEGEIGFPGGVPRGFRVFPRAGSGVSAMRQRPGIRTGPRRRGRPESCPWFPGGVGVGVGEGRGFPGGVSTGFPGVSGGFRGFPGVSAMRQRPGVRTGPRRRGRPESCPGFPGGTSEPFIKLKRGRRVGRAWGRWRVVLEFYGPPQMTHSPTHHTRRVPPSMHDPDHCTLIWLGAIQK